MRVRNDSSKVIGVGTVDLYPGATGEIPESFKENPVILDYVSKEILVVIADSKDKVKKPSRRKPAKPEDEIQTNPEPDNEIQTDPEPDEPPQEGFHLKEQE